LVIEDRVWIYGVDMETTVIRIEGMTCSGCVASVTRVLQAIPGVGNAAVSLEQKQATVEYDAALVSSDQFRQAVENAGFEVA
jgi:copper chaperone